jgi:hypothetical protein
LSNVLDHAGDILLIFVGFWRFLLSPAYRATKLAEWRLARRTSTGLEWAALEIVAAIAFGVILPTWLIAALLASR